MAKSVRRTVMKEAALSEVKDDLSRCLCEAEKGDIVITRHGKPAGVLIGFASEDDWFDYRLEKDPRFLQQVRQARQHSGRAGRSAGSSQSRLISAAVAAASPAAAAAHTPWSVTL